MPITRCIDQSSKSLLEFYSEGATDEVSQMMRREMIGIINWLDEIFQETELFGLTSHLRLVLQSENVSYGRNHVTFIVTPGRYDIEYKLPEAEAPFPNASIIVHTDSRVSFKKYLLIAMKNSEGWKDATHFEKEWLLAMDILNGQ